MSGVPDDDFDSGDLLRRLRPHRGDGYLAPGEDPHADALLQQIMGQDVDRARPARRGRRVAVLVIGATVVGAGATAALIQSRQAGNPTVLGCYSSSDVEHARQVGIEPDARRTPIEQCAELWSDGRISSNGPPRLVACVTDADVVAVLPGDDATCAAAGWVLAAVPSQPISDRTSELPGVLSDRFVDQCLDPAMATQTVEEVLDQLALTQWTIKDSTTSPDSCSAAVVHGDTRSVELISLPG